MFINVDQTQPDSCFSPSPHGASLSPSPQGASSSPRGMSPSPRTLSTSPRTMSLSPSDLDSTIESEFGLAPILQLWVP